MKRQTIKGEISIQGIGLHSGKEVKITLKPAPESHGIKFQRVDLVDKPILNADVKYVVSTNRGTTIRREEAQVSTIEHLMSAAYGLMIDNLLVEIDGPEVPILDGSAKPFVEAFEKVGLVEQNIEREIFEIEETIEYKDEVTGTELVALPADGFEVTALVDFERSIVSKQYAQLNRLEDYKKEIAPCRTFVFVSEIEKLLDQNLIKGGDLNNAIVIADRKLNAEELELLAKKLDKPKVSVDPEGVLNTVDLHFKNEPARHKLLDVIGDLSLIGKQIKGKIVANKPGHTANVEFAKILKQKFLEQRKLKGKPKYDPDKPALFNAVQIMEWLPHRYPFLMVDKIIELSENHVVGIKNISMNEELFQGHFPGNPVFPGVLQMEALAQTGGILALSLQDDPIGWDTYFLKMENVKFKSMAVPGDALILKMELISPIKRGIVHMQGTTYVGNRIVSEGELTAQIVKRKN